MSAIYHGSHYVLAYLPESYMRRIETGDPMEIRYARFKSKGVVDEVYPISGILPVEFHNSIRAEGRNQLVRININDESEIPLLQLVRVRRDDSILSSISRFFEFY